MKKSLLAVSVFFVAMSVSMESAFGMQRGKRSEPDSGLEPTGQPLVKWPRIGEAPASSSVQDPESAAEAAAAAPQAAQAQADVSQEIVIEAGDTQKSGSGDSQKESDGRPKRGAPDSGREPAGQPLAQRPRIGEAPASSSAQDPEAFAKEIVAASSSIRPANPNLTALSLAGLKGNSLANMCLVKIYQNILRYSALELWRILISPTMAFSASFDHTLSERLMKENRPFFFPESEAVDKMHGDRVNSAVFSPDGKHILTATWYNTAKLWNLEGNLVATFQHDRWVDSAVFSPDGKHIVTASNDNTTLTR